MLNFESENLRSENGVWTEWRGGQFLIAHMSSISFQRALSRAQQPYRKKIEAGTLDPLLLRKVTCQAMSEGMLLDWKDVVDKSGQQVKYEPAHGLRMLQNNAEFREFVSDFAMQLTNFHNDAVEEVGNG